MTNGIFPEYRRARMGGADFSDVVAVLGYEVANSAACLREDLTAEQVARVVEYVRNRRRNPLVAHPL